MKKIILKNWERVLFSIAGIVLLTHSMFLIFTDHVTNAAVVFGLGFLSFVYANVSRFKRFKGLGFEAELWEDKKKEAENLIKRLKNIVSIYSRELIMGRVTAGRLGGSGWETRWKLYNDLVAQHDIIGQKIDFSSLKKDVDDYFLLDMCMPAIKAIQKQVNIGKDEASRQIHEHFGSPIRDIEGYGTRISTLRQIEGTIDNAFKISTEGDLAGHALKVWCDAKAKLKRDFDVDIELDQRRLDRLKKISKLYKS